MEGLVDELFPPVMASHCCDMMLENVERTCADHPERPDCLIEYWPAMA